MLSQDVCPSVRLSVRLSHADIVSKRLNVFFSPSDSHTIYLQWPVSREAYNLSNGTIFNDLEKPLTVILRWRHHLTLTISETVRDTDIMQRNTNRDLHNTHALLKVGPLLGK